eukprot:4691413-Heterocapsa_arctica.AAC.1
MQAAGLARPSTGSAAASPIPGVPKRSSRRPACRGPTAWKTHCLPRPPAPQVGRHVSGGRPPGL